MGCVVNITKPTVSTMKSINFILTLLICAVISSSAKAQDRGYRFANTGTDSKVIQSLVDTNSFVYVTGLFEQEFAYRGLVVTSSNERYNDGGEPYILKTDLVGKPVYLKSVTGLDRLFAAYDHKMAINDRGEVAIIYTFSNQTGVKIGDKEIAMDSVTTHGLVIKISKNGFLVWAQLIDAHGEYPYMYAQDIKLDESGNVYVTGSFTGEELDFGNDNVIAGFNMYDQMFFVKYNAEQGVDFAFGAVSEATDTIGGIRGQYIEIGKDGNIYHLGQLNGSRRFIFGSNILQNQGLDNAFVSCYTPEGDLRWITQCIGDQYAVAEHVYANSKGEVVLSCFFNSDVYTIQDTTIDMQAGAYNLVVARFNDMGELEKAVLWETTLPFVTHHGKEALTFIDDSSKQTMITAFEDDNTFDEGFVVFKYTDNGSTDWQVYTTSTEDVYFRNALIDNKNNIFLQGFTYNLAGFTLGGETIDFDAENSGNKADFYGFINKDGDVEYLVNTIYSDSAAIDFQAIGGDEYGGCYVIGEYKGDLSMLDEDEMEIELPADTGMFIAKYNYSVSVSGKVVNDEGNEIPEGWMKLFGYTFRTRSAVADSVQINPDGTFNFDDIPLGKYILVAETDFNDGRKYAPTYFVSGSHWVDADHLILDEPVNQANIIIIMNPVAGAPGENEIGGLVLEVDEDDIFKSTEAKPRRKGRANLARGRPKSDYDIVAIADINEYGNFFFTNVPDGTYEVIIEIPGLPHIDYHEITVQGGQYIGELNYLVGEETITVTELTPITEDTFNEDVNFVIYPNPSNGLIAIAGKDDFQIEAVQIIDVQGRVIEQVDTPSLMVQIDNLSAGMYVAKISSGKGTDVLKFIVNQ